jgi:predicted amidophosphoribosyltransferase
MKCSQCHTKNDPKNKYCKECGVDLKSHPEHAQTITNSELFGKEVDVLFYLDTSTGKISGFVNPTEDQIGRYKKDSVLQRVLVEAPDNVTADENAGAVLAFIRQSKEFLSEDYDETFYRNYSVSELKKEYLRLFEKVLKVKAQRGMK